MKTSREIIVKALRCCSVEGACFECPFFQAERDTCIEELQKLAADLLLDDGEEIERKDALHEKCMKKASIRIERLQSEILSLIQKKKQNDT